MLTYRDLQQQLNEYNEIFMSTPEKQIMPDTIIELEGEEV